MLDHGSNQSITLVGEVLKFLQIKESCYLSSKIVLTILRRLTSVFLMSNTFTNETFRLHQTNNLNNSGTFNTLVTETATQIVSGKSLVQPKLQASTVATNTQVTLNLDNITAARTIRFPDADATLLSTDNVTFDDVVQLLVYPLPPNLVVELDYNNSFYAGF